MIEINSLQVAKGHKTICDVSELSVEQGETIAIAGPNGSGKTTLLRVLAGIEREYKGRCIVDVSPAERTYVHQKPYLFRGSVLSNVIYGLRARGYSYNDSRREAETWLERLGAAELVGRSAKNLSGGEMRRVAVARALVIGPKLLLIDEPLADLDEDGVAVVIDALRSFDGMTTLIASPTELPPGFASREFQLA